MELLLGLLFLAMAGYFSYLYYKISTMPLKKEDKAEVEVVNEVEEVKPVKKPRAKSTKTPENEGTKVKATRKPRAKVAK